MVESKFYSALAVLLGTTVGAGFLGIPYVISKSGFFIGIAYIILIGLLMMVMKLYLGEVTLRTKGNHQLTGYAEKYLGKWGKILMFLSMIFGLYGALLAYLIAEGQSLSYLFLGNFSFAITFSFLFWILISFLSYLGLRALKVYEKYVMYLILLFVILIFILFSKNINVNNLTYLGKDYFAPFGVIIFSFLAFSAMPEVKRILSGKENLMKRVIVTAGIIAIFVYLIFTLVIVGVFGSKTQEIATLNLGRFFSLLGILTMFTASFTQTIAMRDMFRFDFKLGRLFGWFLAVMIPLILFLVFNYYNLGGFIKILGFAGVISGGLAAILILLMNYKSKHNGKAKFSIPINKFIIFIISIVFIVAVVLECLK